MRPLTRLWMLILALTALLGCAEKKAETPPSISAEFHTMLDSLPVEPSGQSVLLLEAFRDEHNQYAIADTADAELERLRERVAGRYHEARELARRGEFDRAEYMLEDLVDHFAETPDGKSARQYLEFEYYLGKAQWLTLHQRFTEAEDVARELLDRDLNAFQANQVETILDNLGHVDTAMSLSERANAKSACRTLSMMLSVMYVEEGEYPRRLTLKDAELLGGLGSTLRGLSAIEDYRTSRDSFSFVGVSESGKHRIQVKNGEIED